ncbi:hypothetical protein Trydic_g20120 [Trypoxylus dichotomus]
MMNLVTYARGYSTSSATHLGKYFRVISAAKIINACLRLTQISPGSPTFRNPTCRINEKEWRDDGVSNTPSPERKTKTAVWRKEKVATPAESFNFKWQRCRTTNPPIAHSILRYQKKKRKLSFLPLLAYSSRLSQIACQSKGVSLMCVKEGLRALKS